MKLVLVFLVAVYSLTLWSAVPTEEGLLKNLNNANIPGNLITIKSAIQSGSSIEAEAPKNDFYKFVISIEAPGVYRMMQAQYASAQMQSAQLKDLKYIPDLIAAIKKEKSAERGMFYSVLLMLAANKSEGMETFLEKAGINLVRNKDVLNEEKMRLLRSYRSYLANNKGKGDSGSPLNPADPQAKVKTQELFRANTFERSKNIELTKLENEFVWKVDWKAIQAYFTNEERQLRTIEFNSPEGLVSITAQEYEILNGTNVFPKSVTLKDSKGVVSKMQFSVLDIKANKDKKLSDRFEEAKKTFTAPPVSSEYSFIF